MADSKPNPGRGITQILKESPKTVTAIITLVIAAFGYYGIDVSFISARKGPELWRYEASTESYVPIDPLDQNRGETILRIDWKGEGREIKSLEVYGVLNKKYTFITPEESPPISTTSKKPSLEGPFEELSPSN
jgi:hypothetical protein